MSDQSLATVRFASIEAALFGEHHHFRRPTEAAVLDFLEGSVTDPETCLLCGGTAGSACARLTRRCLKPNGEWRLSRHLLRKIARELSWLNARTYECRLARALDVDPQGVIVDFMPDVEGDVLRVVWKGGAKFPNAERVRHMLPPAAACSVLLGRISSRGELLETMATLEHCLFGMPLPMLTAIDNPSPNVSPFDAMGPWREFILADKSLAAWAELVLMGGAPPTRNVQDAEIQAALMSPSAGLRAFAFLLSGRVPTLLVPEANRQTPRPRSLSDESSCALLKG